MIACAFSWLLSLAQACAVGGPIPQEDPHGWLEEVESDRSMAWVRDQNNRTLAKYGNPMDSPLYPRLLKVLESDEKIPHPTVIGPHVYNFWQDQTHVRGVWRRTPLDLYRTATPRWETVFDLDERAQADGVPWVWKGCSVIDAELDAARELCLMKLSRGGADAMVVREFNLSAKTFLEGGFSMSESKTFVSYKDRDTLYVGTDMGNGSMTASGYPRVVREWRRGMSLNESFVVYQGDEQDVMVYGYRSWSHGYVYDWYVRALTFFTWKYEVRVVSGDVTTPDFQTLDIPSDAGVATYADQLLVMLRSDFEPAPSIILRSGSLVSTPLSAFLSGTRDNWHILFEPTRNRSLDSFEATKNFLVVQVLDAVKTELVSWRYGRSGAHVGWLRTNAKVGPQITSIKAYPVDADASDGLWLYSSSFLQPQTLSLVASAGELNVSEEVKSMPALFDAGGLEMSQHWATSKDGTPVPYFLVRRADAGMDQPAPALLYGYGGFEVSLLPSYSAILGVAWLERGGVYALANIRGGGEFGPEWHKAAQREGKHHSYEDFSAVSRDLVRLKVTSSTQLAARGGSNGGLLVGNMLVQYPELFGAIACDVPLLDMWRYDKLLAGASWVAEYGDPDVPSDWTFLEKSSPYQNVRSDVRYPPVLFTTSTRDDRVHPAHARKMAAKMQALGGETADSTFFYEDLEGGHSSLLPSQVAFTYTLKYTFLGEEVGLFMSRDDLGVDPSTSWSTFAVLACLICLACAILVLCMCCVQRVGQKKAKGFVNESGGSDDSTEDSGASQA